MGLVLMDDTTRDVTSVYNEAVFQIQRLHNEWLKANALSKAGRYKEWRFTLDAIWRELSRDAIKKESGKLDPEKYAEIEKDNPWFTEWNRLVKELNSAEQKDLVIQKQNPKMKGVVALYRYPALSKMEIFLRGLQDAVGKGGKYKSDEEDDM